MGSDPIAEVLHQAERTNMNLLDFFSNLTHHQDSENWIETTAVFTGKFEQAVTFTKYGTKQQNYNRYEIVYSAGDKQCSSWYSFYPVPDPDAKSLEGTTMRIRYNKRKPYLFEQAEV